MYLRLTFSILMIALAMSCAPFRDSPFSDTLMRDDRNLNVANMQKVAGVEDDGVIRIAIMADSHGNYKDLDKVIDEINAVPDIDFAVHLGDFTNNSYNFEYDQFLSQYARLRVPHFMVIGNHDALGAGPSLFAKAFGPSNYHFESEHVRFIFWNSVGMEDPENFSPEWLKIVVGESTKPSVIFSHVPLEDDERFHGETQAALKSIRDDAGVQAVVNGHNHAYALTGLESTRLLTVPRVENGRWVLFEIKADGFHIKDSQSAGATWVDFKPSSSSAH